MLLLCCYSDKPGDRPLLAFIWNPVFCAVVDTVAKILYFPVFIACTSTLLINDVNKNSSFVRGLLDNNFKTIMGEASCLGSFLRAFINLLFNETLLSIVDL